MTTILIVAAVVIVVGDLIVRPLFLLAIGRPDLLMHRRNK